MSFKTLLTSVVALGLTTMTANAQDCGFRFQSSDPADTRTSSFSKAGPKRSRR